MAGKDFWVRKLLNRFGKLLQRNRKQNHDETDNRRKIPVKRRLYTFLMISQFCLYAVAVINGCSGEDRSRKTEDTGPVVCHRIVSMAPNITETLYALGCGDLVVGVTSFCNYPAEASRKPRVGGYFDPNYEAIMRLKPDMVLVLPEHESVRKYLDGIGIPYKTVHNRTVNEILETITEIGTLCGVQGRADSLRAEIETYISGIKTATADTPRLRALVSIGRQMGTGTLEDVYVAGKNTIYDELLNIAGGANAYSGVDIPYPELSVEGILQLDPDVIFDLATGLEPGIVDTDTLVKDWNAAHGTSAVDKGLVHVIDEDYATIPGPRIILLLGDFAEYLHPGLTVYRFNPGY